MTRLPYAYTGPGGAVAVLRKGEVLLRHTWGWANAERRIPFNPRSLFRICSLTKQFTCATLLAAVTDPTSLDAALRSRLPLLQQAPPSILQMCHNQSGLRDYWALAMLHGARADAAFGDAEARGVIAGTRTLHFAPGTRYAYANQNFRLIAELLEERTGLAYAALLRRHVLDRAGMETAIMAVDTRALPDRTEGYEGNQADGYRPADNRIIWGGDAGLAVSLDDLIAWERHIDATRDDTGSLHARLTVPVTFTNGAPAPYGFGLRRTIALGRPAFGHDGGMRGWRCHRVYVPSERVSVVVMLNHLADADAAAADLLAATLDEDMPVPDRQTYAPAWLGTYTEPETGLLARLGLAGDGRIRLRFGYDEEYLSLNQDGSAGRTGGRRLWPLGDGRLGVERPQENLFSCLEPCIGPARHDVAGRYHCAELDADLTVVDAGNVLYGAASGFLGQGRMELLEPAGGDVWTLPFHRTLDYTHQIDWTVSFLRQSDGRVTGLEIGSWLARRIPYRRAEA
jgi:D-aminopeptidase